METILLNYFCLWNKQRFVKILQAYNQYASDDSVFEVWYNKRSGYVYIALDNWISIAEALNEVEYIVYNFETEEETFFKNYEEAKKIL